MMIPVTLRGRSGNYVSNRGFALLVLFAVAAAGLMIWGMAYCASISG